MSKFTLKEFQELCKAYVAAILEVNNERARYPQLARINWGPVHQAINNRDEIQHKILDMAADYGSDLRGDSDATKA